jgi:hypothetical protein
VFWGAAASPVEVNHVQPAGPGGLEGLRLSYRIVTVGRLSVVVTLQQADDFSTAKVNCWKEFHVRSIPVVSLEMEVLAAILPLPLRR